MINFDVRNIRQISLNSCYTARNLIKSVPSAVNPTQYCPTDYFGHFLGPFKQGLPTRITSHATNSALRSVMQLNYPLLYIAPVSATLRIPRKPRDEN